MTDLLGAAEAGTSSKEGPPRPIDISTSYLALRSLCTSNVINVWFGVFAVAVQLELRAARIRMGTYEVINQIDRMLTGTRGLGGLTMAQNGTESGRCKDF